MIKINKMIGDETFNIHYIHPSNMDSLLSLDAKVFQLEHQIDRETTKQRLLINSQTDVAVWDKKQLVGYISLYPIPTTIYKEIQSGQFDEKKVELATLRYDRMGFFDAYLCGIVIDKTEFPRFKGKYLIELLEKHLRKLKKRGIYIRRIIAHAVSIAGKKVMTKMGFKEVVPKIFEYDCKHKGFHYVFKSPRASFTMISIVLLPKWVDV